VINVKVGVGVSTYDEIGSFGSWNMETIIVLRSKSMHISSIILTTKSLYFYKVCKLRFSSKHVKVIIATFLMANGITFILIS
jgi:hypothetical protein